MTRRIEVAPAAEFDPGDRRLLTVEGTPVGVLNVDGEYYAVENRCRHDGGPVCRGVARYALEGEYHGPGERVSEAFGDRPAITCPWHGWEYYLDTGTHVGDDSIELATYEVAVADGTVYLEV